MQNITAAGGVETTRTAELVAWNGAQAEAERRRDEERALQYANAQLLRTLQEERERAADLTSELARRGIDTPGDEAPEAEVRMVRTTCRCVQCAEGGNPERSAVPYLRTEAAAIREQLGRARTRTRALTRTAIEAGIVRP